MEKLLAGLAAIYGGHSQYSTADIGRAIAGQINNQGWQETAEQLADDAAFLLAERWEGCGNSPEKDAAEIVSACKEQLRKYRRETFYPYNPV